MTDYLLLVAASGLARETAEAATRSGWRVLGCLDDDASLHGHEVMPGLSVLGGLDAVGDYPSACLVLCAGKGAAREAIARRLTVLGVTDDRYAVVTDPDVVVPSSCSVGVGSIVLTGTVLTASVTIGRHVVCMPNVVLTHDDVVEDYATLCAGVALGGSVYVGQRAYLGMNASVRERITVGADAVVGMGAAVVTGIPDASTHVGVPAGPIETHRREQ
jgi:sugar O-acyltransferase (sialic acid O-acetyltransferase NeuD family)